MKKSIVFIAGVFFSFPLLAQTNMAKEGVSFQCSEPELEKIGYEMDVYLQSLKIDSSMYKKFHDQKNSRLTYIINSEKKKFSTVDLAKDERYQITDEEVDLPMSPTEVKKVKTVSRKEIVLALFHHGRKTEFSGKNCTADSFIDHVGIRQNTVLWAQNLEWQWPDGGPAFWNVKYWNRGTPHEHVSVTDAFMDMFYNQKAYGIGCYTATKIVMVQGVLDYYKRVRSNPEALNNVLAKLLSDKDPLVAIEPRRMWSFEKDFDVKELNVPGKILVLRDNVAPLNFVPGDWTYFLNTDSKTNEKTGYEGSNAVYLGRGLFDDYYNDNNHSYTYKEKLDEVYQWRNGVFSRSRDAAKIKPVTSKQFKRFGLSPDKGGLVMSYRVHHEFFN